MILQTSDDLEEYIGNKYALVIVAAKRARQLKEGHNALSRETSAHPLSIALREIDERKLSSIAPPEEDIAPAPRDVIASLISGTDFDLEDDMDLEDSDAVDDLAALLVGSDDEEEEEEVDRDLLTAAPVAEEAEEDEEAADTEVDTSLVDSDDDEEEEEEPAEDEEP